MDLHVFEQFFFHQYWFHLYFWTAFVIFNVLVTVTWYQWKNFAEACGIEGKQGIDNVSRYIKFPTRVGTEGDENGCWYYSQHLGGVSNTSNYSNVSAIFSNSSNVSNRPEYACMIYYTQHDGGLG